MGHIIFILLQASKQNPCAALKAAWSLTHFWLVRHIVWQIKGAEQVPLEKGKVPSGGRSRHWKQWGAAEEGKTINITFLPSFPQFISKSYALNCHPVNPKSLDQGFTGLLGFNCKVLTKLGISIFNISFSSMSFYSLLSSVNGSMLVPNAHRFRFSTLELFIGAEETLTNIVVLWTDVLKIHTVKFEKLVFSMGSTSNALTPKGNLIVILNVAVWTFRNAAVANWFVCSYMKNTSLKDQDWSHHLYKLIIKCILCSKVFSVWLDVTYQPKLCMVCS